MNWLSESGGKSAGRPPKIDEVALRERYGEPAVELITLLYRLRDEGGFSIKQAAQAWARRHPDDPLVGKVLGRDGEVDQRRLSELMKMPQPLPRGLVHAFVDLWFAGRERGEAAQRAALQTVDRLNVLDATVRATAATSPKRTALSPRSTGAMATGNRDRVQKLLTELEEVRQERDRFRHLTMVLAVIILRLDEQLDLLLGPATRSPDGDPRATAGHAAALQAQLSRADQQRDQALLQIERAIVLATRLQDHITQLHDGPALPHISGGTDGLASLPEHAPVLTDNEQALDRVEEMLPSLRLDQTYSLVSADDKEIVRPSDATPDNPVTSDNVAFPGLMRWIRSRDSTIRTIFLSSTVTALFLTAATFIAQSIVDQYRGDGGPSTQSQATSTTQSTSAPSTSGPVTPLLAVPVHPDYPFSFYNASMLPDVGTDPNGLTTTLTWDIDGSEKTIPVYTGRGQPLSNFGYSITIYGALFSSGTCAPTVRFIEGDQAITERLSITLPDGGGTRPADVDHFGTGEWPLHVKILPTNPDCRGRLTWIITGLRIP